MMNFNIITSICRKGGIGYKGNVPWTNSNKYDMLFSKLTRGNGNNALLMDQNKFDTSIMLPLMKRFHMVLCSETDKIPYSPYNDIAYFPNVDSVISHCTKNKYDDIWIIGGEKTFSYFLNQSKIPIKNMYFNFVKKDYVCDAYIPLRFNENDKFETLDAQIVNDVEQIIVKVHYNRCPV